MLSPDSDALDEVLDAVLDAVLDDALAVVFNEPVGCDDMLPQPVRQQGEQIPFAQTQSLSQSSQDEHGDPRQWPIQVHGANDVDAVKGIVAVGAEVTRGDAVVMAGQAESEGKRRNYLQRISSGNVNAREAAIPLLSTREAVSCKAVWCIVESQSEHAGNVDQRTLSRDNPIYLPVNLGANCGV